MFKNVTAVNVFSVFDGGFIAVAGNTGAPDTAYNLTARASVPLPGTATSPSDRTVPLSPADDWWAARQQVRSAGTGCY